MKRRTAKLTLRLLWAQTEVRKTENEEQKTKRVGGIVATFAVVTQDGIKTSRETFSPSSIAGAKIGIKKSHKSYEQYIELSLIREKEPFRFNTFRGDYTIADFYERYDGALFLDGTQTPVQIETFGLELIGEYLDGNRLVTHKAARKLREFGTSGAAK